MIISTNALEPNLSGGEEFFSISGDDNAEADELAVLDPDFSTAWISGGGGGTVNISYNTTDSGFSVDYVAIAGHNLGDSSTGRNIRVLTDGIERANYTATRDNNGVIMITFTRRTNVNGLSIQITKSSGLRLRLGYVAFGSSFAVPNGGEQSGYDRQYLAPPYEQRNSKDRNGAPVAYLRQRMSRKGKLTVNNMAHEFAKSTWLVFQKNAASKPFFVMEIDGEPETAYLCFEPIFHPPKAHASTRALVKAEIEFIAFTGLE